MDRFSDRGSIPLASTSAERALADSRLTLCGAQIVSRVSYLVQNRMDHKSGRTQFAVQFF